MSAKGFNTKPIVAIPLYVISEVKKSKFKAPVKGKVIKDTLILNQNQFEFVYKEEILNEIMLEFLESKGLLSDDNGDISERR